MIPDPWSIVTGAAGAAAGWSWDQVAAGIARWVLEALTAPIDGTLNFLKTSARPSLTESWFAGADSPFYAVRNLAAVLLVGFLLAGIIQGLIAGDVGAMLRRIALDAPLAVLGMVGVTAVVEMLLDLTDAMSTTALGGADSNALKFLGTFGVSAHVATGGFNTVVLGIVALIATLFIWIELMVRASLVYVLVAMSPLVFAASVWPAAKGMLRRLVELLLAVILSKLVICIALAVGVAALGGAAGFDERSGGVGEFAAQSLGSLVVGTAILAMAAFSPFILLRMIPMVETAVVAQGISRAPLNTGRSVMNTAYYGQSLGRLAGRLGGGGGEDADAPEDADTPGFVRPESAGNGLGGGAGGSTAGAEAAGAAGAEAGAGSTATAGGAGGAGAAGAAGASVAAGPVAVVAVGAAAAKAAKDTAESTAGQAAETPNGSHAADTDAGWRAAPDPQTPGTGSDAANVDPASPPAPSTGAS